MRSAIIFLFILLIPNIAHAYLDPISISYVFTLIIGFIAFIFRYVTNFFSNFNYLKKTHLVNLLFLNAPLVQFLSLNINKGQFINFYYLIGINLFITLAYFIFFFITRKFFLKNYKDILFFFCVLFLIQFQFNDIYKLSLLINIRILFIAIPIILIFFSFLFYKKTIIQDFLSRFILIFNIFLLSIFFYNYSLNYFEVKNLKKILKEEEQEFKNNNKKGENIYFVISDALIDLKIFENEILKAPKNKNILHAYKSSFEENNFSFLNNSMNTSKVPDTANTLGGMFNLNDNIKINNLEYKNSYPVLMKFYENSTLAKKLNKNNYDFYWSGNIWNNCKLYNENLCLENDKNYNDLLYSTRTIWNYLSSSYLGKKFLEFFLNEYFYKLIHAELDLYDHLMIKTFPVNKNLISKGNNFFFIHDWGPHPPFTYNSDCSFKSYPYDSKKGYENAYMCNIDKIYRFTDYLKKNDPNSIIIITADHGYFEYRRNIFRIINFGNCKYDEKELSKSLTSLFNKAVECAIN